MNRRSFLKTSLSGLAAAPALRFAGPEDGKTKIAIVKTQDRASGVKDAVRLLDPPSMRGKRVFIKPNFNTADPFPAGTHNGTLTALVQEIKSRGAADIALGERSGPRVQRRHHGTEDL
ncbi:MAG: hypothetical protein A2Y56_07725 [Candidatus Aminicenantes bacterium RBG_13_63_10]|jgi:uncharacterized protein (DUF362 family)|nr:MAG: hypothetical protein A2Y56_07725 [Candidatus Aminicenantes bacterium RBG_13_63_10]